MPVNSTNEQQDMKSEPEKSAPETLITVTGIESYEIQYVHQVDDKHKCVLLVNDTDGKTHVLVPPVKQLGCGHRICERCVPGLFEGHDSITCPSGDDDCDVIGPSDVHPDMATTKEINRLKVYCPFRPNGCQVILKRSELSEHVTQCTYAGIKCSNVGCDVITLRSDVQNHLENECDYALIDCDICNELIPRKDMKSGEHQRTCKPKPRPCEYHKLGCEFQGTAAEIQQHMETSRTIHESLMAKKTEETAINVQKVEQTIDEIATKVADLQSLLGPLQPNGHENALQTIQKSLVTLSEKLTVHDTQLNDKVSSTDFSACANKVMDLQRVVNAQESRLSNVESNSGSTSSAASGTSHLMSGETAQRFRQIEGTVGAYDVRFAENELRFRLLETASHDGWMVWKITNYAKRKKDAIDGRTLSLYSQPFYTAPFGYRMCARTYLNGDGMGRGTHLSLFFVVMRSEYDALLSWPFRQRVTICLIDQSGRKRHVRDSFRPDPTSTSFRRPTGEMNVASGSPMFALQATVESDAYLKDDTIFIGVKVDKDDMEVIPF